MSLKNKFYKTNSIIYNIFGQILVKKRFAFKSLYSYFRNILQ